jgi:hypothetical protein
MNLSGVLSGVARWQAANKFVLIRGQPSIPQIWGSQGPVVATICLRYATAALWAAPALSARRPLVPGLILACLAAEAWWLGQRVSGRRSVRDPVVIAADVATCVGLIAVAAMREPFGVADGLAWAFPFAFGTCVIVGLGLGIKPAPQARHPAMPVPPGPERMYLEIHGHLLPIVDAVATGVPLTREWTALAAWEAARARRLLRTGYDCDPDPVPGSFGAQMAELRDGFTEAGMALSVVLRIAADPPAAPGLAAAYAAREALTNVLKHAGPRCEVHLYAEAAADQLEIIVTDRGGGFVPAEVVPGSGFTRTYGAVRQLGGVVEVSSAPGSGTRVRVRWPAAPREHE